MSTDSVTLRSAVLPGFDGSLTAVLTDTAVVVGASALIAASAQVVVHTGLTPVPFTLQTFAVLVTGAALGSLRGTLSMARVLGVGAEKAISLGVTPFIWAEVVKLVAAGVALPGLWSVLKRVRH